MKYAKDKDQYVIRIEKGGSLLEKLEEFSLGENINSAYFSGIGAFLSAEIGFYDLDNKSYLFRDLNQPHEIASLTGNISQVDGKPFFHIHCVLSDINFKCVGGHLKKAIVDATCEIYLKKIHVDLERKQDDGTGLKLLDLEMV